MWNLQRKWKKDLDILKMEKCAWVEMIDEFYKDFETHLENSRKGNGRSRN